MLYLIINGSIQWIGDKPIFFFIVLSVFLSIAVIHHPVWVDDRGILHFPFVFNNLQKNHLARHGLKTSTLHGYVVPNRELQISLDHVCEAVQSKICRQ